MEGFAQQFETIFRHSRKVNYEDHISLKNTFYLTKFTEYILYTPSYNVQPKYLLIDLRLFRKRNYFPGFVFKNRPFLEGEFLQNLLFFYVPTIKLFLKWHMWHNFLCRLKLSYRNYRVPGLFLEFLALKGKKTAEMPSLL